MNSAYLLAVNSRPHVLFVTYNGLLEPLGLRQGLAYLEPLTDEFHFSVVSFEKQERGDDPEAWDRMKARLDGHAIDWCPLRYHARPSVPATIYDVWAGARAAKRIHRSRPLAGLHARGYVPAAVAWRAGAALGVPFLFDIRGLMADEYVDGGIWTEGSLPWRITRSTEKRLLASASATVTLTETIRPEIERRIAATGRETTPPSEVIPCCVDTQLFTREAEARARTREELGLGNAPVVVYSGSVGTWYASEPLVDFFREVHALKPDARLLLLMNGDDGPVRAALSARGVPDGVAVTVRARPDEVPSLLSAADLGVAFIRPSPSKRASSPTKIAEYLACGLPTVVNTGVGDLDRMSVEEAVVVAGGLEPSDLRSAAERAVDLIGLDPGVPRALALRDFDLRTVGSERYRRLYRAMMK